jgi:hypothetical protein
MYIFYQQKLTDSSEIPFISFLLLCGHAIIEASVNLSRNVMHLMLPIFPLPILIIVIIINIPTPEIRSEYSGLQLGFSNKRLPNYTRNSRKHSIGTLRNEAQSAFWPHHGTSISKASFLQPHKAYLNTTKLSSSESSAAALNINYSWRKAFSAQYVRSRGFRRCL